MINKIKISILSIFVCASSFAQNDSQNSTDGSFKPQKGDWQISINLGNGDFMPTEDLGYLLPDNKLSGGTLPDIGLGYIGSNQSASIGTVLNTGSFNKNSIANIASFEGAYFVTDAIQVNAVFSMDIASNPSISYIEGENINPSGSDPLDIPGYAYMEANVSSKYMAKVGANYYIATKSERVQLFAGLAAGYGCARIDAQTPYTGVEFNGDPVEIYQPSNRIGLLQSVSAISNVGIEYSFTENLNLAFEVSPFSYTNSALTMQLQGFTNYNAVHSYFRVFAFPTVKLGVRF